MRVLLIDDDKSLTRSLPLTLGYPFSVATEKTASAGIDRALDQLFDVIIVDLALPDMSGIEACRLLRQEQAITPVLMLTAHDAVDHCVSALDAGADDFLGKPFSIVELRARLRALYRRTPTTIANTLCVGRLELDLVSGEATNAHQPVSQLRRKELHILELLMRHPGQIMSRRRIFDALWQRESESSTNLVDVHIKLLRDKIDKPFHTNHLKTIHGLGYKITA